MSLRANDLRLTTYVDIVLVIFLFVIVMRAEAEGIRLIVRGDDLGMSQGSIAAFERAFNEGILTCASLLTCAPWLEAATRLISSNPQWCVGVHLSLIGEWRGYRWRPVSPWERVSSIVDQDGFLLRYPEEVLERKPRIEEIESEFRAQIQLAIKKGVKVHYFDAHYMGPGSYPGLERVFEKLSREFGVPISGWLNEKRVAGIYKVPVEEKKVRAIKMLESLTPGLWLWVNHLGIDSPEQNAMVHTKAEDFLVEEGVGKHRAEETKVLTSPEVKSMILRKGIKLTNYRELWERMKRKK